MVINSSNNVTSSVLFVLFVDTARISDSVSIVKIPYLQWLTGQLTDAGLGPTPAKAIYQSVPQIDPSLPPNISRLNIETRSSEHPVSSPITGIRPQSYQRIAKPISYVASPHISALLNTH